MTNDQLEHLIRLRGAWQMRRPDDPAETPRRVVLPTSWPAEGAGTLLLTRRFQRPPVAAGRERVRLRLEAVAGLVSVRLNGDELARPAAGTEALELDVEGLLRARNELVLEVAPPAPGAEPSPWGAIALVIGPTEARA